MESWSDRARFPAALARLRFVLLIVMLVRKFYVYGSVSTPFKFQVDPLIL